MKKQIVLVTGALTGIRELLFALLANMQSKV
jgi:hypothetical protein